MKTRFETSSEVTKVESLKIFDGITDPSKRERRFFENIENTIPDSSSIAQLMYEYRRDTSISHERLQELESYFTELNNFLGENPDLNLEFFEKHIDQIQNPTKYNVFTKEKVTLNIFERTLLKYLNLPEPKTINIDLNINDPLSIQSAISEFKNASGIFKKYFYSLTSTQRPSDSELKKPINTIKESLKSLKNTYNADQLQQILADILKLDTKELGNIEGTYSKADLINIRLIHTNIRHIKKNSNGFSLLDLYILDTTSKPISESDLIDENILSKIFDWLGDFDNKAKDLISKLCNLSIKINGKNIETDFLDNVETYINLSDVRYAKLRDILIKQPKVIIKESTNKQNLLLLPTPKASIEIVSDIDNIFSQIERDLTQSLLEPTDNPFEDTKPNGSLEYFDGRLYYTHYEFVINQKGEREEKVKTFLVNNTVANMFVYGKPSNDSYHLLKYYVGSKITANILKYTNEPTLEVPEERYDLNGSQHIKRAKVNTVKFNNNDLMHINFIKKDGITYLHLSGLNPNQIITLKTNNSTKDNFSGLIPVNDTYFPNIKNAGVLNLKVGSNDYSLLTFQANGEYYYKIMSKTETIEMYGIDPNATLEQ